MKKQKVIEILEKHNEWRRDNSIPPKTKMQNAIEIGTAIDYAIKELKKEIDFNQLREAFFNECTTSIQKSNELKQVCMAPHDLFNWFKNEINEYLK